MLAGMPKARTGPVWLRGAANSLRFAITEAAVGLFQEASFLNIG